jgi:hypothetical protein
MFDNLYSTFAEGMTMQRFGWTALAVALMLAGTGKSQAQDTIRLGGTGDAAVQSLEFDGQADTEQVYWRGGGYRGGYRGGFYRGGFYGGYRGGYYGGYRGGFYRPYIYRPYFAYRPFYRPFGYGYGYGYYSPSYSYAPSYDYGSPAYSYYVNPCATDAPNIPNATVLGSSSYAQGPVFQTPSKSSPEYGNGTYPYDGGPGQPMPLPAADGPAPTFQQKRPTVPLDGKQVSIPGKAAKYTYPAYGETVPQPSPTPPQATPLRVVSNPAAQTVRVSYPAYGDR